MASHVGDSSIDELLLQYGLLTQQQINSYHSNPSKSWLYQLFSDESFDSKTLALLLKQQLQLPLFELKNYVLDDFPVQFLIPELIKKDFLCPLQVTQDCLLMAMAYPQDAVAIRQYEQACDKKIKAVLVDGKRLLALIEDVFSRYENSEQDKVDVIPLVEQIIHQAINEKISDIHFEPQQQHLQIRFRKDGLLKIAKILPQQTTAAMLARVKILANLDIAEKRLPQDGRFQLTNHQINFRVNTCPTLYGEKIVIRLLQNSQMQFSIDALGFAEKQYHAVMKTLQKTQGLILVCGPTGSGKTMTLYSLLQQLNSEEKNIASIEDPIEIDLANINQVNVHNKIGLNFATILRAFLRQDPDIIMVGEIRDEETANIAIKAAQTGHLILATIHTNSAIEAITRLRNMGIADYEIASSLSLVISQRLLRRLCENCKTKAAEKQIFQANGCHQCHQGYNGRVAAFETLTVDKKIAEIISQQGDVFAIEQHASHWQPLAQAAQRRVFQGLTTMDELQRVIAMDELDG